MKKVISITLCLVMVLSIFTVLPIGVSALETDIAETDGSDNSDLLSVGVKGFYYANTQEALDRVNAIRYEACSQGIENPSKAGTKLTMSDYHPLKWSSALENTARVRAAEALVQNEHTRPNNKGCFSIDDDIVKSRNEILAWNFGTNMVEGINQFYSEKTDWINNTGKETGHYTALIDPNNYYIGFGGFFSNDSGSYPSSLCGRLAGQYEGIDETQGTATGNSVVSIEIVSDKLISTGVRNLSHPSTTVVTGSNSQLEMYGEDASRVNHYIFLNNITWRSSDSRIAAVDAQGVVTAKAEGTVTITAESGRFSASTGLRVTNSSSEIGKSGFTGDCIWTLNGTELTISGTGRMADYGYDDVTPWGKAITKLIVTDGVTEIGAHAFCKCGSLTSISLGKNIHTIGLCAFQECQSLTGIVLPQGITAIRPWAFLNCVQLKDINFPDSLIHIGFKAFCGTKWDNIQPNGPVYAGKVFYQYKGSCPDKVALKDGTLSIDGEGFNNITSLKEVVIPGSVKYIGECAFLSCTGLQSITIPDSVTEIKGKGNVCMGAFSGCTGLKTVTVGKGVVTIGEFAFYNCTAINAVNISDLVAWLRINFGNKTANPLFYTNNLYLNGKLVTDLIIPNGVDRIPAEMFEGNTNLKSVTIPNSVTCIDNYAFSRCSNLTNVSVSNGVATIGMSAFSGCTALTDISIPDSVTSIGDSAFSGCSALKSVSIGKGVATVGEYAFNGCSSLNAVYITDLAAWFRISFSTHSSNPLYYTKNLYLNNSLITDMVIPEGVTTLPEYFFQNNTNLKSVTIPFSVKTIDNNIFSGCTNLTRITIKNGLTSIGDWAFSGCTALTGISIPSTLTSIGNYAFYGCSSLNAVYISDLAAWLRISFGNSYSNPLYNAKNLYLKGKLLTDIVIPDGVKSIPDNAFYGNPNLKSVIIPASVTSIGDSAFCSCDNLTTLDLSDGLKSIGDSAFTGCYKLDSVVLPDSMETIGESAFSWCYGLKQITVPDNVRTIGKNAFPSGCALYAFNNAEAERFAKENKNSFIQFGKAYPGKTGNWSWSISRFFTLTIKGKGRIDDRIEQTDNGYYLITSAPWGAGVKKLVISSGITEIGEYAFSDSKDLTSVTLPDSLKTIDYYAFEDCEKLKSITVPASVTDIEWMALGYCYDRDSMDYKKIAGFTVKGYKGTAAEKYAEDNGFIFIALDSVGKAILGDTDGDGEVTIIDATAIQRHLADLSTTAYNEKTADADEDGSVTILDATAIQRHLADMQTNKNIGKPMA